MKSWVGTDRGGEEVALLVHPVGLDGAPAAFGDRGLFEMG